MASDTWRVLGLEPARLQDLEGLEVLAPQTTATTVDAQELPESLISFHLGGDDQARRLQMVEDWRALGPVARIVNTILLCAIRDGAEQITLDPQARGVHVRFTTCDAIRDHIKLPSFTLAPITGLVKTMAQIDTAEIGAQHGLIKLRVNDLEYALQVSTHSTPWGERVELRFAPKT